jgi:site-specific recombinase XerC
MAKTGADDLAEAEDLLAELQRLLGHDHLATTEIYLSLSPEHVIKEFMEKW